MNRHDLVLCGYLLLLAGVFLLGQSLVFRSPRRILEEIFAVRSGRLESIEDSLRNRTQTSFGTVLTLGGFFLLALALTVREGRSVLLERLPSTAAAGFALALASASLVLVLRGLSKALTRIVFKRSLKAFFREHPWTFEENLPLMMEVGSLLGIPRKEDDSVEGYVRKLRDALRLPPSIPRERSRAGRAAEPPARLPF
jgi:hypothetical protein